MTNVPKSTGSQLFQTESQLIFPGSGPFSKSFKLHLGFLPEVGLFLYRKSADFLNFQGGGRILFVKPNLTIILAKSLKNGGLFTQNTCILDTLY
jgi:hypothetical protein